MDKAKKGEERFLAVAWEVTSDETPKDEERFLAALGMAGGGGGDKKVESRNQKFENGKAGKNRKSQTAHP